MTVVRVIGEGGWQGVLDTLVGAVVRGSRPLSLAVDFLRRSAV